MYWNNSRYYGIADTSCCPVLLFYSRHLAWAWTYCVHENDKQKYINMAFKPSNDNIVQGPALNKQAEGLGLFFLQRVKYTLGNEFSLLVYKISGECRERKVTSKREVLTEWNFMSKLCRYFWLRVGLLSFVNGAFTVKEWKDIWFSHWFTL